uniref:Uncharacterized protein n=1 Tax=viral metagenome TaxID=1070528 RepID=A0A6C0KDN9_9ZZZZ
MEVTVEQLEGFTKGYVDQVKNTVKTITKMTEDTVYNIDNWSHFYDKLPSDSQSKGTMKIDATTMKYSFPKLTDMMTRLDGARTKAYKKCSSAVCEYKRPADAGLTHAAKRPCASGTGQHCECD